MIYEPGLSDEPRYIGEERGSLRARPRALWRAAIVPGLCGHVVRIVCFVQSIVVGTLRPVLGASEYRVRVGKQRSGVIRWGCSLRRASEGLERMAAKKW
jgi:hypothetical protein